MFFKLIDTNKDGFITKQEFDNFWFFLRNHSTEDEVITKIDDFLSKFKSERVEEVKEASVLPPKITVDDFEFYKNVGEGSFGQVYLALYKHKNTFHAIK